MESADIEIEKSVSVHISPAGGMAADSRDIGEDSNLVADIAEDKLMAARGGLFFRGTENDSMRYKDKKNAGYT